MMFGTDNNDIRKIHVMIHFLKYVFYAIIYPKDKIGREV